MVFMNRLRSWCVTMNIREEGFSKYILFCFILPFFGLYMYFVSVMFENFIPSVCVILSVTTGRCRINLMDL